MPLQYDTVKTLSEEQSECFLKILEQKPIWINAFFSLLYHTGMRISECIALKWSDIDFDNNLIKINKQHYRYRVTTTKNYATREIDMPHPLKQTLLKYFQIPRGSELLFSSSGKHISVNNMRERHFRQIIKEVENKLGTDLSTLTPHCLRHTHATYLLSHGIPLIYVSRRLGHKDCKTTLITYNHVLPSDCQKALEVMNNLNQSEIRAKKTNAL